MDIQRYYAIVREKRGELAKQYPDGCCLVVSLYNLEKNSTAGNLCEVTLGDAARLITDGTHREATEEEVRSCRAKQDKDRLAAAKQVLASNALHQQITDVVRQGVKIADLVVSTETKHGK